ncbi:hypothetical protein [Vibrio hannami]|uniref:hypothetical protein n=1 Tax=Vibrio hannami TaxID=2717094 RepID=UPI003EBE374B
MPIIFILNVGGELRLFIANQPLLCDSDYTNTSGWSGGAATGGASWRVGGVGDISDRPTP